VAERQAGLGGQRGALGVGRGPGGSPAARQWATSSSSGGAGSRSSSAASGASGAAAAAAGSAASAAARMRSW
jgi:hypothetical protein